MATETIPFGLRRYKLGIGIFLVGGLGFVGWSFSIDAPMFVFPLGHLEACLRWLPFDDRSDLACLFAASNVLHVDVACSTVPRGDSRSDCDRSVIHDSGVETGRKGPCSSRWITSMLSRCRQSQMMPS